ncbi:MAG: Ig-like domain-containing protein [Gallionella sp.]|nr:Ig-like domain-containing protein [Gallionella sp.]MDD2915211.1 Ig-like domain-containing protein [Gallionella sp.]
MNKFKSVSKPQKWYLTLLLTALMAGCGGGGGGDNGSILGSDTGLAPAVTDVAPLPNATAVPINFKLITATFTKTIDPATLTAASFKLACPTGTPVTGTVAYLATGNLAELTLPAATNLPINTVCTATVTTAVKDTTGIPLAGDFTWTFTTGATADTTAPTVSSTVNANGATNVATNTQVGATFSEVMDPSTINTTTFTLKQGATAVPGTVTYNGVSTVFTPASVLATNTNYTATITTGGKDLAGNALANNFAWSWTTAAAADTTAPTVSGTIHTNGQTNVAVNTTVGVTFSEGMNPSTINNLNFTLTTDAGAAVPGTVSYSGVNAVFRPLSNLAPATHYNVKIKGGTGGVTDLAGNPMAANFTIGWTTAAAPDTTAPTVILTSPANVATNVPIRGLTYAYFSEWMDPLTITTSTFTVTSSSGTPVTGTILNGALLNNASFTPLSNLAYSSTYTAKITTGVKDLAGNALAANKVWSFTTEALPPTTPAPIPPAAASGGVCVGASCVNLGTAANYVILAKTGADSIPNSVVTGNVGVSPIARAGLTGWSLIAEPTDTFYTSAQVTGKLYAADMVGGTTSSDLSTAVGDMATAYTAAAAKAPSGGGLVTACPGVGAMSDATDGGPLAAGVYTCAVNVTIPGNLTLNGTATDVWVFQITGKLTQANGTSVLLTGGALAKNVFWQVSDVVDIGTTAHMEGNILAQTNIALRTGATINGRLLAQTAVTLDTSAVTQP